MIPDKYRGARGAEIVMRILDLKGHSRRIPHHPFVGTGDGPLGYPVVSHETQDNGYEDSVAGADDEGDVACEETGEEAGEGKHWREHVEG